MIVPSIDLQGGRTVQLIGGEKKAIDAGDPLPIARRFRVAGEIAVIDLDAAMGKGSNAGLIEAMLAEAPTRVGGGTRTLDVVPWDIAQVPFAGDSASVAAILERHLAEQNVPRFTGPAPRFCPSSRTA